jgi:uracil-DNA glycosylase family 4
MMLDTGPHDADILIVTDSPTKKDVIAERLFSDGEGRILKQMLSHSGIDFNSCYITSVLKHYPPNGDFSYMYDKGMPTPELDTACKALRAKIQSVYPKKIIVLGNEALQAVCNKKSIKDYRGTWLSYKNIPVMPVYHPNYIMKVYGDHVIAEMDLAKAANRKPKDPPPIILRPSVYQVQQWIENSKKYNDIVAFDIETVQDNVRCISFATRNPSMSAIVIPFITFAGSNDVSIKNGKINLSTGGSSCDAGSYWSISQEVTILDILHDYFNSDVRFIGQNSINFDEPFIRKHFGIGIKNHVFDTMLAWHHLYSELPKSLNFLCSVFTDYPNYWADKDSSIDNQEWIYNAMDSIVTYESYHGIKEELMSTKLPCARYRTLNDSFNEHVMPLAVALQAAQHRGVVIDIEARAELDKSCKARAEEAQKGIDAIAGTHINCNSPKQVKTLLYDTLRYPEQLSKDSKGVTKASSDETAILSLQQMFPEEPLFKYMLDYRRSSKLSSTFLSVKTDENNRMHTAYNVAGTKTYRISSSQNLMGEGMNLQNIPVGRKEGSENLRHLFKAGEGNSLIKSDLSQAETLVVARILCRYGDRTLYENYKNEAFDIHTWMASKIYNKPEELIEKNERHLGKTANHSGNYCSGPGVIKNTALKFGIDISWDTSKIILEKRHSALPGLRVWWQDVERKLVSGRTLYTCMGRRRIFFNRLSDQSTIRDAVSFEPQSIVGDVCNEIFRKMYSLREEYKGLPILQVHDEVVSEVPDDYVDTYVEILKEIGKIPLKLNDDLEDLIIPLEIKVGKNWRDMEVIA